MLGLAFGCFHEPWPRKWSDCVETPESCNSFHDHDDCTSPLTAWLDSPHYYYAQCYRQRCPCKPNGTKLRSRHIISNPGSCSFPM